MPTLDTVAEFTWMWGHEFHLETSEGCFIWSSPDYSGDNTIRPTPYDSLDMSTRGPQPWGRDKGKHTIREYCGSDVKFVEI